MSIPKVNDAGVALGKLADSKTVEIPGNEEQPFGDSSLAPSNYNVYACRDDRRGGVSHQCVISRWPDNLSFSDLYSKVKNINDEIKSLKAGVSQGSMGRRQQLMSELHKIVDFLNRQLNLRLDNTYLDLQTDYNRLIITYGVDYQSGTEWWQISIDACGRAQARACTMAYCGVDLL